jgi:hypothetical protein
MNPNHPTEEQIRLRAYQIYLEHGCRPGHDIDDWLQAEYELMRLPLEKIAESEPPEAKIGNRGQQSVVHLVRAVLPSTQAGS